MKTIQKPLSRPSVPSAAGPARLEMYSSAYTLSDMEIFVFPQLLYGLMLAHDHVQSRPGALVLLVTAETLSPLLDPGDFSTHILFGDAATAVLVGARGAFSSPAFAVTRPLVRANMSPQVRS